MLVPPEKLPFQLAPSKVRMSMAALTQHPSSQAPLSPVALKLNSLWGQRITYEIEFKLPGRHPRTLPISLQLSKLLPPVQLISSLFSALRNPRHSSTPEGRGPLPRRAMFPHYQASGPAVSSARKALSLLHHLAPAVCRLQARPCSMAAGPWEQNLNRWACECRELQEMKE